MNHQAPSLTRGFFSRLLDIIAKAGAAEHLNIVRRAIENDFIDFSLLDLEFLKKHGEWRDIPLVVAATSKNESGVSLLGADNREKYRLAAKTMYGIGKHRLANLFGQEMPKQLLAQLVIEVSESTYRKLSNQQLMKLLLDPDDSVRRACALKSVRAFGKRRLTDLLADYMQENDQRYYNVIHWLDMGISVPTDIARKAASKAIAKEWPNDLTAVKELSR